MHVDDDWGRDGAGDCHGGKPVGGPPQFGGLNGYGPRSGVAVLAYEAAGDDAPAVFDVCWVILLSIGYVSVGPK